MMEKNWHYLFRQNEKGRLPHGLLFSGISSQAILDFAKRFAQFLLCTGRRSNASSVVSACENCQSCHLFAAKAQPDYWEICPEEKSKSITIDQIRALSHALTHTPQLNHHQVALIYPAQAMTIAAANALLKTLEEPSGSVFLILLCDNPKQLPATLSSRCQVLDFTETVQNIDFDNNPVMLTILTALCSAYTNPQDYHPIVLAKYCLDFPLEIVLESFLQSLMLFIKVSVGLSTENHFALDLLTRAIDPNLIQHYFHYYDRLLEIKKLIDQKTPFNAQVMWEYLWITWRVNLN